MTEITNEQFERYIQSVQNSMGLMDKIVRQYGNGNARGPSGLNEPRRKLERDLNASFTKVNNHMRGFGEGVRLLDTRTRELGSSFVDLTKRFAGGAIIGTVLDQMIRVGTHWVDHYRELVNVGQDFNGSMLQMARTAAQAGMPLADFANYVKKNSRIMATFGSKDVTQLAKSVRKASHQVGMYGYTIEGMNDVTATWLEMQRLQGAREIVNRAEASKSILTMAKNVTELSATFGTAREVIMEQMKQLASSSEVRIGMLTDSALQNNPVFQEALGAASAMQGKGGEMFRDLFQNMAAFGSAINSSTEKQLREAGLDGPVERMMQNYMAALRSQSVDGLSATRTAAEQIVKFVDQNAGQLRVMGQYNEGVRGIIAMADDLRGINWEERARQETITKRYNSLTDKLLSLDDKLNDLKGRFLDGLLSGLEAFGHQIDEFRKSESWELLQFSLFKLGKAAGGIAMNLLAALANVNPNDVQNFIQGVATVGRLFVGLGEMMVKFLSAGEQLGEAIGSVIPGLGKFAGGIAGLIAAFAVLKMVPTMLMKFAGNLMGTRVGSMRVNAGVVTVNGRPVGGAGGGVGGGSGGRGGWRGRLAGAARGGGKVAAVAGLAALLFGGLGYAVAGGDPAPSTAETPGDAKAAAMADPDWAEFKRLMGENNDMTEQQLSVMKDSRQTALANFAKGGYNQVAVLPNGQIVPINNNAPDIRLTPPGERKKPEEPKKPQQEPPKGGGWLLPALGGAAVLGGGAYGISKLMKSGSGGMNAAVGAAMLRRGGVGGALKGAGGLLGRAVGPLGLLLEGASYFGDRDFTLKNVGKSALRLGGGALGGLAGSLAGPLGTAAGGIGGYMAGDKLANWLLGEDDVRGKKPVVAGGSNLQTPGQRATVSSPGDIPAAQLQRTAVALEQGLSSPEVAGSMLANDQEMLKKLQTLISQNEGVLDKLERNLRNQVQTFRVLKDMKDQAQRQ